jgi:hypothetical protein
MIENLIENDELLLDTPYPNLVSAGERRGWT